MCPCKNWFLVGFSFQEIPCSPPNMFGVCFGWWRQHWFGHSKLGRTTYNKMLFLMIDPAQEGSVRSWFKSLQQSLSATTRPSGLSPFTIQSLDLQKKPKTNKNKKTSPKGLCKIIQKTKKQRKTYHFSSAWLSGRKVKHPRQLPARTWTKRNSNWGHV